MSKITVANTFENNKLVIGFDFHDGLIPFAPFELTTNGDIELNPLVIKLTELLERNLEIEYTFEGVDETDDDNNKKLKLIKSTLEEIYNGFNRNVMSTVVEEDDPSDSIEDDDDFI